MMEAQRNFIQDPFDGFEHLQKSNGGHKYIKREGSSGNYRYFYEMPQGISGQKPKEQVESPELKRYIEALIPEGLDKQVDDFRKLNNGMSAEEKENKISEALAGHRSRAKEGAMKLHNAIVGKDYAALDRRLSIQNKNSLKYFYSQIGVDRKISGITQKQINADIRAYVGEGVAQNIEAKEKANRVAQEAKDKAEAKQKKLDDALAVKIRSDGKILTHKEWLDDWVANKRGVRLELPEGKRNYRLWGEDDKLGSYFSEIKPIYVEYVEKLLGSKAESNSKNQATDADMEHLFGKK